MQRITLTVVSAIILAACSAAPGVDPGFLAQMDNVLTVQDQYAKPPASDPLLPNAVRVKVIDNGDPQTLIRNVCAYAAGHQYKIAHVTVYKYTEMNLAAPNSPPMAEKDC